MSKPKQRDDSTIQIKKCPKGWYFLLICPNNKKTVGMSGRYYPEPMVMIDDLKRFGACAPEVYTDKMGQYRFRFRLLRGVDVLKYKLKHIVMVKSEAYTQKHNALSGMESVTEAMHAGRVTNLAAENTDILNLSELPAAAIERRWFNDND